MGPHPSALLSLRDTVSDRLFLIDTGAQVSVIPGGLMDHNRGTSRYSGPPLTAANGTHIPCYGESTCTVCFQGRRYEGRFVIADVQRPLLGADFLLRHRLLVDLVNRQLVSIDDLRTLPCSTSSRPDDSHHGLAAAIDSLSQFELLLRDYPRLTLPDFSLSTPQHGVVHHIATEGRPVWSRPRRLDPTKLQAAKSEFSHLRELGIIRPSNSCWSSPLHMVRKSNNEWRPCGDYRRLNAVSTPDRYPVPHIQDFTHTLASAQVFTVLDLVRGYHQIPVAEDDVCKTAITTPFGLWEFVRMPFGLRNAGQTFQRMIDAVLRDLDCVFVYIDDILIASSSEEQHARDLQRVFQRLQEHGLLLRPDKCRFGLTEVNFLGHHLDTQGIRPLPEKVSAVANFPRPSTPKELQTFLGMMNFYHRFIPHAASFLYPLHDLAKRKPAKEPFQWTDDAIAAFNLAKAALSSATALAHPLQDGPLAVCSDASEVGVGACLQQLQNSQWVPLAFFSKRLRPPERKYSAFDRELLAAYLAARHFRHMIEGRVCSLFTDHKPLAQAWKKTSDPWSARQQRQLSTLAEFFCDVQHWSGKDNAAADALSRAPIDEVSLGVSFEELSTAQSECPETRDARTSMTGLRLKDVKLHSGGGTVLCDCSLSQPRPLVPPPLRRRIFDALHNLSHPGTRATKKIISSRYVWHRMSVDITRWCQECTACQLAKVHHHTKTPVSVIPMPDAPFQHVHVDLVGPLPPSQGYTYLLTIIDRYTRWPEAIPLSSISADVCSKQFLLHWVARYGIPLAITSDRGRQFTSNLWRHMADTLGSKHHFTTSYHPQSNGMIERWHRSLKASLRARLTDPNWMDQLPWVLLGLRTAPKEDLGGSPCELTFKCRVKVPGDTLPPGPSPSVSPTPNRAAHHGQTKCYVPKTLLTAPYVLVRIDAHRTPLERPYAGPFKVVSRSDKYFTLDLGNRRDTVSVDRLKPAATPDQGVTTRSGRISRPPARLSEGGKPCGGRSNM